MREAWGQEPGIPSRFPVWVSGIQLLGHCLLSPKVYMSKNELRHLDIEHVCATDGILTARPNLDPPPSLI